MQYSLRQKSRGVSCIRCYTTKFVNYKDLKPFVKDLKEVYQAATEKLALTSCITSYVVSVHQTRDLPVGEYVHHIQLPSNSTSQWTPLPSAISFPLPGGFGICTRWKRAPLGALAKPRLQVDSLGMLYNLHSRHNAPKKSLIAEGVTS